MQYFAVCMDKTVIEPLSKPFVKIKNGSENEKNGRENAKNGFENAKTYRFNWAYPFRR